MDPSTSLEPGCHPAAARGAAETRSRCSRPSTTTPAGPTSRAGRESRRTTSCRPSSTRPAWAAGSGRGAGRAGSSATTSYLEVSPGRCPRSRSGPRSTRRRSGRARSTRRASCCCMEWAFDHGFGRVQLKTDIRNARSQRRSRGSARSTRGCCAATSAARTVGARHRPVLGDGGGVAGRPGRPCWPAWRLTAMSDGVPRIVVNIRPPYPALAGARTCSRPPEPEEPAMSFTAESRRGPARPRPRPRARLPLVERAGRR